MIEKEDLIKDWKDEQDQEKEDEQETEEMENTTLLIPSIDLIIEHPFSVTIFFLMGLTYYLIHIGEMRTFAIPLISILIVLISWKFYDRHMGDE